MTMSKKPNGAIGQLASAMTSHILKLQARCDALEAMVLALGMHLGAERKDIRDQLETACATYHHKRLEALEDLDPEVAANLPNQPDLGAVDLDLLKRLRFRS